MWRATGVLPTNDSASTPGWPRSASTASASPCSTLKVPSGKPASRISSASSKEGEGSFSEGFKMNALPHASAFASIQSGTMTGKLNGVMPATTPTGWSTVWTSTPLDTSELWDPFSSWGTPQANSTHSRPRATSPAASERTLPCSWLTSIARSWRRLTRSSRSRNIMSVRCPSGDSPHGPAASAAHRTAASTSAAEARLTVLVCTPSAGSKTGADRPDVPAVDRPPTQCSTDCISVPRRYTR